MRLFRMMVILLCAVLLIGSEFVEASPVTETDSPPKPIRPPKYEHFMFGVFMDSSKERELSVPLTKVFTDFLTHGIEIVVIGTGNYSSLAREKKLNTFAKANGVQFIHWLGMPDPGAAGDAQYQYKYSDEEFRAIIKGRIEAVNALPDSDAVVGWRIGDEIESTFWDKEDRKERLGVAEKNFQRFSRLIREIDPKRRVVVNHYALAAPERWSEVHEDEALSSTFFTGIYNSYRVREQIAEARRLGLDNYFLVTLPQPCPREIGDLRWYGYREPINGGVLDSRTVAQDVQDYGEVAYTEGAAGIMYFLYWAGGDNYNEYSLVDLHGDDNQGKWDAVRKAARNIRRWEGAPSCAIVSPKNRLWTGVPFTITVEASAPPDDPVTVVKADYSLDGALSWTSLPDAVKPPYNFNIDAGKVKELPRTIWVRVRAINKRGTSLWDVIEVRCSLPD